MDALPMTEEQIKAVEMPNNTVQFPAEGTPTLQTIVIPPAVKAEEPAPVAVHKRKAKRKVAPRDEALEVLLADLIRARNSETLGPVRLAAVLRHVGSAAPASKVWLQHEFHLLLKDLIKAKEPKMTRVRQEALVKFLGPQAGTVAPIPQAVTEVSSSATAEESEAMTPAQRQNYAAYMDRQMKERFRKDPQKSADEAAKIIGDAIKARGWGGTGEFTVLVPRTTNMMWLEAACKRAGIRFTAMNYSLMLQNPKISNGTLEKDADRETSLSGGFIVTLS